MIGIFMDGKAAPGLAILWLGGKGFTVRRISVDAYGVNVHKNDLSEKNIDLQKKINPDNVHEHVRSLFERLSRGEIPLKEDE